MVLGNISCDLEARGQGQRSNNVFSCKCIISKTDRRSSFQLCTLLGHLKLRLRVNISCDLDQNVKVNSQIMYFL